MSSSWKSARESTRLSDSEEAGTDSEEAGTIGAGIATVGTAK